MEGEPAGDGTGLSLDLSEEAVAAALPGRDVHVFPALVSSEADAVAWARAGAPEGAVVVADYQISLRGWAGRPWPVRSGQGLAFSIVLRPRIAPVRAGWLYIAAITALLDVAGTDLTFRWPDEADRDGERIGSVVNTPSAGVAGLDFCAVSVMLAHGEPPRAPLLARLVEAVESRYRAHAEDVLADYRPRCSTLGREVCASFFPLGPRSKQVVGRAVDVTPSGALVVETEAGMKLPLHVQDVGRVDLLDGADG